MIEINKLEEILNRHEDKKTYTHLSDLMNFVNHYEKELDNDVKHKFLNKISVYTNHFKIDKHDLNPKVFEISVDK